MENDEIEELAVNIIEQEILKYRDLKSGIPKGDKGISWDGHITVFDGKGKKIIVFKYKPKKNYRRKQGHRQPYTKVEITSIKTATKKTATKKATEKTETKKVAEKAEA